MTEPTDAELGKLAEECGIGWGAGLGGMSDFLSAFARAVLAKWAAPQQEAQEPATVPYQKLTNEIDQILSDPDTELSIGAKRALLWVRTWVSVPLWTTPQPAPDCHHRPPCDECAAIAAQGGK